MAPFIKDMFDHATLSQFAETIHQSFECRFFLEAVFDESWNELEIEGKV